MSETTSSSGERRERLARIRRVGLGLIVVGGLVLILGWGFAAETWARATGWLLAGIGFACEMVYGQGIKALKEREQEQEQDAHEAQAADESATGRESGLS